MALFDDDAVGARAAAAAVRTRARFREEDGARAAAS